MNSSTGWGDLFSRASRPYRAASTSAIVVGSPIRYEISCKELIARSFFSEPVNSQRSLEFRGCVWLREERIVCAIGFILLVEFFVAARR